MQVVFFLLFADEIEWIDAEIKVIKSMKKDINHIELLSLKNPFIISKELDKTEKITKSSNETKYLAKISILILDAIINNSALISSHWYSVGDRLIGYRVIKIDKNSIILSKLDKSLTLVIGQKNYIPISRVGR